MLRFRRISPHDQTALEQLKATSFEISQDANTDDWDNYTAQNHASMAHYLKQYDKKVLQRSDQTLYQGLVAFHETDMVGCLIYHSDKEKPWAAHIDEFFTYPSKHNKVGSHLIKKMITLHQTIHEIALDSSWSAVPIYERMGFLLDEKQAAGNRMVMPADRIAMWRKPTQHCRPTFPAVVTEHFGFYM